MHAVRHTNCHTSVFLHLSSIHRKYGLRDQPTEKLVLFV
jgi:hypothetical protein